MGVYLLDTHHFVMYVVFIFWFGAVGGGGGEDIKKAIKTASTIKDASVTKHIPS